MCEIKTVSIAAASLLAAGFCVYQANSQKKVEPNSHPKIERPCEKGYKKYCLNGGECYCLVDEDIVDCICTWLYGRKRCEKYV